jgi:hypothetical protein
LEKIIRIHQFGKFSRAEFKAAGELIRRGVLVYHGYVDRRECLGYQAAADLLLLVNSNKRPSMVPGKLYEYLTARKPVMVLGKPSAACQIIEENKSGVCLDISDVASISTWFLKNAGVSGFRGLPKISQKSQEKFYLKNQIRQLDLFLKSVI